MSLVAYGGSSDEEENEQQKENQEDGGGKVVLVEKPESGPSSDSVEFSKLPQPVATEAVEEVQDEFLKKKEEPAEKPSKPPVKISVPSVSQFESDEEDNVAATRAPQAAKSSGLFAVLPPPKGTPLSNTSFVPQVLARKPQAPVQQTMQAPPERSPPPPKKDDEEDDDLWINYLPSQFDESMWKKVCAPRKRKPQTRSVKCQSFDEGTTILGVLEIAPEPEEPYNGLDNEAFKQLVGSSKRRRENIRLIDISEEQVTPDKDLWLTKSLTDPEMAPKQPEEEEEPVNNTSRRKHHITYLAQKAKAQEQDLQTQWSHNRYKQSLTRSKYGF